jgi:hypothetical protein
MEICINAQKLIRIRPFSGQSLRYMPANIMALAKVIGIVCEAIAESCDS